MSTRWFASAACIIAAVVVACGTSDPAPGASDAGAPSSGPPVLPVDDAGASTVPVEPPKACPSAGRRCVPSGPAGWAGPMIVFDGAPGAVPECPSTMALRLLDARAGTLSGAHTCSPCGCGAVTGATCQAWLNEYSGNCTGTKYEHVLDTTCIDVFYEGSLNAYTTAAGGGCAPSGGAPQLGTPTWDKSLRGCAAPALLADGCSSGEVCAPDPAAPFGPRHCIANVGDLACPAPWTAKALGHGGADDTRGCDGCSCGEPQGLACTGTFLHNSSGGCGGGQTLPLPLTTCVDTDQGRGAKVLTLGVTAGSCAPGGGALKGGLAPKDPVTVCCLP